MITRNNEMLLFINTTYKITKFPGFYEPVILYIQYTKHAKMTVTTRHKFSSAIQLMECYDCILSDITNKEEYKK